MGSAHDNQDWLAGKLRFARAASSRPIYGVVARYSDVIVFRPWRRSEMKFHVTVTPRRPQVPPVAVIDQSIDWIKAKLSDKTADCCYGFIGGGGVAIFNADTSDAMLKLL